MLTKLRPLLAEVDLAPFPDTREAALKCVRCFCAADAYLHSIGGLG
jgi:hypothetical protein